MKSNPSSTLASQLDRLKTELETITHPESRAAFARALDGLIERLATIRSRLSSAALEERASEIQKPLTQVIEFLEYAKTDETLAPFISQALHAKAAKTKRPPLEIPPGLTNEQIRSMLDQDLSRAELKQLAGQRGISIAKATTDQIKQDILRSLERQEGYQRLARPQ